MADTVRQYFKRQIIYFFRGFDYGVEGVIGRVVPSAVPFLRLSNFRTVTFPPCTKLLSDDVVRGTSAFYSPKSSKF